jgi:hypothetical protein
VKDNPKANAKVEEEDLAVRGETEENNNLLLRPNNQPPQLDRFVPLSDSYEMGYCMLKNKKSFRNIQNTKVLPQDLNLKKHPSRGLTEDFLSFL